MKTSWALALLLCASAASAQVKLWTPAVTGTGPFAPLMSWCTEKVPSANLTECTNPDPAPACVKTGDWLGAVAGKGTETAPIVTTSAVYGLKCDWPGQAGSMTLSWIPPTHNEDGTPYTNPAGYVLIYNQLPNVAQPNTVVQINNPGLTTYKVEGLSTGVWYSVMRAKNTAGVESARSNVAKVEVTAAQAQSATRSVGITIAAGTPTRPRSFVITAQ